MVGWAGLKRLKSLKARREKKRRNITKPYPIFSSSIIANFYAPQSSDPHGIKCPSCQIIGGGRICLSHSSNLSLFPSHTHPRVTHLNRHLYIYICPSFMQEIEGDKAGREGGGGMTWDMRTTTNLVGFMSHCFVAVDEIWSLLNFFILKSRLV